MQNKKKGIIVIASVVVIAIVAWSLAGKSTLVYSFDGKDYDREDYYEQMKEHYGKNFIYQFMEKEYLSGLDVDEAIKSSIANQEASLLEQNSSEEDQDMIGITLRAMGYNGLDELNLFLTNQYHKSAILQDNVLKVFDDLENFQKEMQPRIVTHVLVQAQRESNEHMNSDAPLDAEIALMGEVDAALDKADNVTKTMIDLSSDNGIIGESLGYMDNSSQLVESFIKGAQNLNEDEISEWVKSEFGYHRIYVESTNIETIKEYPEFKESVFGYDSSLEKEIMIEHMQSDGVEISDSLLKDDEDDADILFKISNKTYDKEDVLDEILKLDYGQFLIGDLEQIMLEEIKNEKNYDVSAEVDQEVKNFENAGLDFEMMLAYYGFRDEAHLRENLESALVLDKYANEIIDEKLESLLERYELQKLYLFQVESEDIAKDIETYVKNDYEVDEIKNEFDILDSVELVYYKGMSDLPDSVLSDLNEHKVALDIQENYALVFAFGEEVIDEKEAKDVILNHTSFRDDILKDMILDRGFKVHNKTLKKNLSVDYQDYLN
ncbi:MAG: hypothetical protein GX984_03620 [Erysipelothrix sp.]|nr:hypothetical protein [Erysipelothrix sp.]